MSAHSDGTNTYTYKYDANGIRTQKNDKQYIIDINNNVVAETDSAGAIESEILWGNGKPLARKTNGSWYYYIYNAHGDVVGLVNDTGTVVNTYEYTPWGEIHNETETVDNPIKYAGEYYDDELGMYYLRARYYDPQIGRFTSRDIEEGEISNPLDMNRYVYCRNNPIKYVDPTGKSYALTWGGSTWWLTGVDGPLPVGDAIVVGGVIVGVIVDGVRIMFAKKSKSSGKEKSSDVPSWAKGEKPKEGESGNDFAKRLMDKKYGKGNYRTGPGSEYNKLRKYGDRGGK